MQGEYRRRDSKRRWSAGDARGGAVPLRQNGGRLVDAVAEVVERVFLLLKLVLQLLGHQRQGRGERPPPAPPSGSSPCRSHRGGPGRFATVVAWRSRRADWLSVLRNPASGPRPRPPFWASRSRPAASFRRFVSRSALDRSEPTAAAALPSVRRVRGCFSSGPRPCPAASGPYPGVARRISDSRLSVRESRSFGRSCSSPSSCSVADNAPRRGPAHAVRDLLSFRPERLLFDVGLQPRHADRRIAVAGQMLHLVGAAGKPFSIP